MGYRAKLVYMVPDVGDPSNGDEMIDRVYTNSTDEHLYATLDAVLEVYGHKIQDGQIVPSRAFVGIDCSYEYMGDLSDFHNGQDPNGRLSFLRTPTETMALFAPQEPTMVYIGYTNTKP